MQGSPQNKKSMCVCVCLWLILSVLPAIAKEDLYVDFDKVIQENFLGINAVYHAFTYMPESIEQGMTDELRKIEFDRIEESGIRIARTFYRPDWAMGEGVWTEPDWESVKMNALYAWLKEMQQRNVDVALNMGWWFARDVIWNRDQHLPSYPDDMHRYSEWVSESLHQIIEIRGFTNVKYIFMFTEPGNNFGDIPHRKKGWDYYKEVLRSVHKKLYADKRRHLVKMVGPNTTQAPRWVEQAARELDDVIDIYSSHNYNFNTYQKWYEMAVQIREACKATGKPFWIDEYGFQDFALRKRAEYGNVIAQANAAFINAGAQSSLIWILNDQYYPYPLKHITNGDAFLDGKHSWGLYPWLPESRAVRPAWNLFALLSKLMGGEGTKVFAAKGTENLHIASVKHADENISILVVSGSEKDMEFSVSLSEDIKGPIVRYSFGAGDGVILEREQKISGKKLNGTIHPKGVFVYSTINDKSFSTAIGKTMVPAYKEENEGNLAFLKKVTVTSAALNRDGSNLTDGKRLTYWEPEPGSAQDQEILVDLGHDYKLHQIDVYMEKGGSGKKGKVSPENLSAMVSEYGEKWTMVPLDKKSRQVNESIMSFKFSKYLGRYVRIFIKKPKTKRDGDYHARIKEIKVYGAGI